MANESHDELAKPIEAALTVIREELAALKMDALVQVNALDANNDISWDCYDVNNWRSMVVNAQNGLDKLAELKIAWRLG